MPIWVKGVYVTTVIQCRRDGAGVDAFYVVNLCVGFHRNLPVTVEYKRVPGRQSNFIELKFCPFIGNRAKIFEQADTIFIEVHKDEVAEPFTANRDQAAARKIKVSEVFRVPN